MGLFKALPGLFRLLPAIRLTTINPPEKDKRQAINNSYDNSILYADYVIDSAIHITDRQDALSYVMYLSDHGEDLFDAAIERINFHLSASPVTLHVPLFLWTSWRYREAYPDKQAEIVQNKNKKIGSENTFFSLLDLADIDFKGNDLTKSIASPSFAGSTQGYFNNNDQKEHFYNDFDTIIEAGRR